MNEPPPYVSEIPIIERSTFKETIKNIAAGGVGAMTARALCQPLDVAKVRFQVTPNQCCSLHKVLYQIYKDSGLKGLWRGHNIAQVSGIFQGAVQFVVFGELIYSLENIALARNTKHFLCGFLTGITGVIIISPFEMVKTHLIAKSTLGKYETSYKTVTQLFNQGGFRGVYKGALPSMIQIGPLIGSRFMLFHLFSDLAMIAGDYKETHEIPAPIMLLAGGSSGMISNVMLYPLDVVKRRMQLSGINIDGIQSCSKLGECIFQIMQAGGVKGFYRGIIPSLIKSTITVSVSFTVYTKIKGIINKFN